MERRPASGDSEASPPSWYRWPSPTAWRATASSRCRVMATVASYPLVTVACSTIVGVERSIDTQSLSIEWPGQG